MSPKEKAKELVKKYYRDSDLLVEDLSWIQAKECALIAADEILNNNTKIPGNINGLHIIENIEYWQEVKEEIEKL